MDKCDQDKVWIDLWIGDRLVPVVQATEDALKAAGFEAKTTVDDPYNVNTYILSEDQRVGTIDVTRLLLDVATEKPSLNYDRNLSDPLYEAAKIRRAIGSRIEVVKALFTGGAAGDEAIEKLRKLSETLNLRILLVRRD